MSRPMTATMPAQRRYGGGRWTPGYLAFVLPLTPEQVLVPQSPKGGFSPESRAEWTWINTAQRLTEQYGADEALLRLNGYGA